MKVIQIVTQLEPGGAQAVAIRVAKGLRERGFDCATWFLFEKTPAFEQEEAVSVLVRGEPSRSLKARVPSAVFHALKAARPDAVVTHTHYANVITLPLARALHIRKRIAVHHSPIWAYPRWVRPLDTLCALDGTYTRHVAVSNTVEASAPRFPSSYRGRLTVIPNGIDFPDRCTEPRDVLRRRHGIPTDRPLLISTGRLAEEKNHRALINALPLIPDAHFAVVGEGPLRSPLLRWAEENRCRDRVHLLGTKTWTEVLALLQAADVFVFPSTYEAMGLAVIEALWAGIPVVANNISAMQEVVGEGGLLCEANNPIELSAAVNAVLSDNGLAQRLRSAASNRWPEYSLKPMLDRYERLLR